MSFDTIRSKTPKVKGKCSLCKTAEKAGTLNISVRDKDTKTVASRSVGVCEKCGTAAYTGAMKGAGIE